MQSILYPLDTSDGAVAMIAHGFHEKVLNKGELRPVSINVVQLVLRPSLTFPQIRERQRFAIVGPANFLLALRTVRFSVGIVTGAAALFALLSVPRLSRAPSSVANS